MHLGVNVKWFRDTVERTLATYLEAFLGLLLVDWSGHINLSTFQTAVIAAVPAGLAVLKAALSTLKGDPTSASLAD